MSEKKKTVKIRDPAGRKNYYAAQFSRTVANKKRNLRRHLRAHPDDRQSRHYYEDVANFGSTDGFGVVARAARRARHRSKVRRYLADKVAEAELASAGGMRWS